jgi:hypothetical protein
MLEVCMGLGLAEKPRRDPAYGPVGPGPGRTDNVLVEAGFGPGPNDSNQTFFLIFYAFSGHSFSAIKNVFIVVLISCS